MDPWARKKQARPRGQGRSGLQPLNLSSSTLFRYGREKNTIIKNRHSCSKRMRRYVDDSPKLFPAKMARPAAQKGLSHVLREGVQKLPPPTTLFDRIMTGLTSLGLHKYGPWRVRTHAAAGFPFQGKGTCVILQASRSLFRANLPPTFRSFIVQLTGPAADPLFTDALETPLSYRRVSPASQPAVAVPQAEAHQIYNINYKGERASRPALIHALAFGCIGAGRVPSELFLFRLFCPPPPRPFRRARLATEADPAPAAEKGGHRRCRRGEQGNQGGDGVENVHGRRRDT